MPEVRGRKKPERRQAPEERLWERIREERKETNSKAEYREPGRNARETRRERTGKAEGAKARAAALRKPLRGGDRKKGKGRAEAE